MNSSTNRNMTPFAKEDGFEFRRRTYDALSIRFVNEIDQVMSILASRDLLFPAMNSIHRLQLRRPLIERHCLPFLLTHSSFFADSEPKLDVLAACVAAHTLALTHLDYHLDGSEPSVNTEVSAVKVPPSSAVSYAVRMVYESGSIVNSPDDLKSLFNTVLVPVSGFVVSRMHEDWLLRTEKIDRLSLPSVEEYLNSDTSRILASGYWEVMIRAAFIGRMPNTVDKLIPYCRSLRKLRQLVDELVDLEEDLAAGVITLPVITGIALRPEIETQIRSISSSGSLKGEQASELLSYLRSEAVLNKFAEYVNSCYINGIEALANFSPEVQRNLSLLLELKMAKFSAFCA